MSHEQNLFREFKKQQELNDMQGFAFLVFLVIVLGAVIYCALQ